MTTGDVVYSHNKMEASWTKAHNQDSAKVGSKAIIFTYVTPLVIHMQHNFLDDLSETSQNALWQGANKVCNSINSDQYKGRAVEEWL